jgi:predicted nucleotidyltransferase component of viral defense system
LNDKPSLQDLLEVQRHFGLPSPALVEKDWYVVKAIAALATANVAPFQLVFSGGTALSRAYRLIRRMSEDIDLKIVSTVPTARSGLRHLREIVTHALLNAGFEFDPESSRYRESGNGSRYTLYRLPTLPSWLEREPCGRKFRSRQLSGPYAGRPLNGL